MRIVLIIVFCALVIPSALGGTSITFQDRTVQSSGSQVTVNRSTVVVDGKVLSNDVLEGSGTIASENRDLGDFEALRLDIAADVTVVEGETPQCEITADDNLLPVILTTTLGKVLRISAKESYSTRQKVNIVITTQQLKKAEINGSGTIDASGVLEDRAEFVISGSGIISARGEVTELRATINGSGYLRAEEVQAKDAKVIINGSGDADVHVIASLTAEVNGSGNISYLGTPSKINRSVKGSGSVSSK